ncbi:MAG: alkaline phosphatase family protein [Polyangiales bacterium]
MKLRAWAAALVGALAAWGAPRLLHSQSVDDAGDASRDAASPDAAVDAVETDAIADAEPPAPAPARRPYDHVVIVSFDGMRPDGMERADAPMLHRLRAEGTYALQAETVGDSSTLPSHSSMLSGVEVEVHGMEFDDFRPERGFIRFPTVLYRAHDLGLATAMFVAKTKLRHIAIPGSVDVWSLPHWSCERVARAASAYLPTAPAGITFIHFEEPDDAGHRHHWMSARYIDAIARTDRCLTTVMAAIEGRADRDRVLVMISADHGGHGRRHGTHNPLDLHIPWIAWGSRVLRGDFDARVRTTDTGVTAMAALGLDIPSDVTGHVVRRVFEGAAEATANDAGGGDAGGGDAGGGDAGAGDAGDAARD